MEIKIDLNSVESYKQFLKIKSLPRYRFSGRMAYFPDEYAGQLGIKTAKRKTTKYNPPDWMFDYQKDITRLAIAKKKFCLFIGCGLGKTPIHLEFAMHALNSMSGRNTLIVAPLMVIKQELEEVERFYGGTFPIEQINAAGLQKFLSNGSGIGITNYEAIRPELTPGKLGCLVLSESSMLKSHYGKWGTKLIELGRGLEWKLCETGTPAPNDRIEFANHAVFMDAFPTVNAFLARFFVNRGQTQERWEIKQHAVEAFYLALSHFSIFMENPATYGWKDNTDTIPPITVHIHDVGMTDAQNDAIMRHTGELIPSVGGITSRSKLAQIAKGRHNGNDIDTLKPQFIRNLVDSWCDGTIIWCKYNDEQDKLAKLFPDAVSLQGRTPQAERQQAIDDFKSGRVRICISKPEVMGLGLNLQIATRQVFSACEDSFEDFWQCVKRSNRVGSTRPLNVHLPVTEAERPMMENVLRKAAMVQRDTEEQERIFKANAGFSMRSGNGR